MAKITTTEWLQEERDDGQAAVGLRVRYDDESEFILTAVFPPDDNRPLAPTAVRVYTALVNDIPLSSVLGRYDALREVEDVLPEVAYPVLGNHYYFADGSLLKADIAINFVPPDTEYISESVEDGLADLVDLAEYCSSTGGGVEVQAVNDLILAAFEDKDEDDEEDDLDDEDEDDEEDELPLV